MQTQEKTTTDSPHSSPVAAEQKPGSGITDKFGGVMNVIHGAGEVIRGHALEAGDFGRGRGEGREIIAAGKDEVERGLNRAGRPTATSATGHDQDWNQRGDGTGAVPGHDSNTPQGTADPTSEKGSGDATDTRHLADRGTAGAAANGTDGSSPEKYHGEKTAATAPPHDAAYDPGDQPSTDVRQQGNGIAPTGRGTETRSTADT